MSSAARSRSSLQSQNGRVIARLQRSDCFQRRSLFPVRAGITACSGQFGEASAITLPAAPLGGVFLSTAG
jgi:hypothetical protein